MTETNESTVPKYLNALENSYFNAVLSGRRPTLCLATIEPDRRKHSRVGRELTGAGLLEPNEPEQSLPYVITERVLDSIPDVTIDLCAAWKAGVDWDASASTAHHRPWIRLQCFDFEQKKSILRSESFDFFAVNREAYTHWGKLADLRATVTEGSRTKYQHFWDGPYETISEALQVVGVSPELMLCVSSPALRTFVETELHSRKFAALYVDNTLWGLVECGIVEHGLVFDEYDKPLIDSQFHTRTFPFIGDSQQSQQLPTPGPPTWPLQSNIWKPKLPISNGD